MAVIKSKWLLHGDRLLCDNNWKSSKPGLLPLSDFLQFLSMMGRPLGHCMLCDQGFTADGVECVSGLYRHSYDNCIIRYSMSWLVYVIYTRQSQEMMSHSPDNRCCIWPKPWLCQRTLAEVWIISHSRQGLPQLNDLGMYGKAHFQLLFSDTAVV